MRRQPEPEREPLPFTPDPYHPLKGTIGVNGVDMAVTFATPRELAEALPVIQRPWNADGIMHPEFTKLNEYHPAKHVIEVCGYPVTVEFEGVAEAVQGLAAYLGDLAVDALDSILPKSTRTPRAPRATRTPPTPPANAGGEGGEANQVQAEGGGDATTGGDDGAGLPADAGEPGDNGEGDTQP